jgi:Tyrosine phosphatase family
MGRHRLMRALALALAFAAGGCSPMIYEHGVPNLDTVEAGLYRIGCPTKTGWDYLVDELHVRSYLRLSFEGECSSGYAEARGVRVFRIEFEPGHAYGALGGPSQDQLHQVAAVLADESLRPLAYGCLHGEDRTGVATGTLRLERGGDRAAAYAEMLAHHFHPELLGLKRAWDAYQPQPKGP